MQTHPEYSALNPFPWYRHMRENEPVVFNRRFFYWQVFRYDDVQRTLSDYTAFSSKFVGGSGKHPFGTSLITLDPPRHRQLRNLVTTAFTPRAVARLGERIESIVEELLAPALANRRLDIIEDLAVPMPLIVIADMLGIPAEHRRQFKVWSDKLVGMVMPEFIDPQLEMREYFLKLFEERRREPQNDLISDLLKAEQAGEKLSEQEILGFCVLLLVAGNETTTNLIGNTFLCFDEMPELFEQLRSNPELIPAALEEVARYLSPLQFMFRRAAETVELGGQTIKAGQIVHAYIGSANRDENQFAEPDRFDLTRANSKHLAYGNGIHYCIGAPLARLQAKIALTYVVKSLRNVRLDPGVTLEANSSRLRFLYGVKHLPILFDR